MIHGMSLYPWRSVLLTVPRALPILFRTIPKHIRHPNYGVTNAPAVANAPPTPSLLASSRHATTRLTQPHHREVAVHRSTETAGVQLYRKYSLLDFNTSHSGSCGPPEGTLHLTSPCIASGATSLHRSLREHSPDSRESCSRSSTRIPASMRSAGARVGTTTDIACVKTQGV